jgi:hypothetical protein
LTCDVDLARLDFYEWLPHVAGYALSLLVVGRCFGRLLLDLYDRFRLLNRFLFWHEWNRFLDTLLRKDSH